ncbi:hypothetical protein PIN31009_04928 [Pandoraea iniqua]|nr:hypothetical protein PIN31009_04928 [Pandoraea iniqua]
MRRANWRVHAPSFPERSSHLPHPGRRAQKVNILLNLRQPPLGDSPNGFGMRARHARSTMPRGQMKTGLTSKTRFKLTGVLNRECIIRPVASAGDA